MPNNKRPTRDEAIQALIALSAYCNQRVCKDCGFYNDGCCAFVTSVEPYKWDLSNNEWQDTNNRMAVRVKALEEQVRELNARLIVTEEPDKRVGLRLDVPCQVPKNVIERNADDLIEEYYKNSLNGNGLAR